MSASLELSPDLERYRLRAEAFNDAAVPDHRPAQTKVSFEPRIVEIVREFNDDVAHALHQQSGVVRQSRDNLIPEQEAADLPQRARLILDRYAVVDALAIDYRDRTRRTFIWL